MRGDAGRIQKVRLPVGTSDEGNEVPAERNIVGVDDTECCCGSEGGVDGIAASFERGRTRLGRTVM